MSIQIIQILLLYTTNAQLIIAHPDNSQPDYKIECPLTYIIPYLSKKILSLSELQSNRIYLLQGHNT